MKLFSLLPKRLIHFACNSPSLPAHAVRRRLRPADFEPAICARPAASGA